MSGKATTPRQGTGDGAWTPRQGMVLAAGRGLRMRPLTGRIPKPLVTVAGRTLLDRALDRLVAAGIAGAVVNTHHLGEQIERHLAGRDDLSIRFSPEPELLDTGGGVAQALGWLGPGPFVVANSDSLWVDGDDLALCRLAAAWDDGRMDALLLLHPVAGAHGYDGRGDYTMAADGALCRRREGPAAPLVFTGVQILHPRLFDGAPGGPFPLVRLYDQAEAAGRLFGLRHTGEWFHVGTPEGVRLAEAGFGAATVDEDGRA